MLVPGKTMSWKDFGKALKVQWSDDKISDFSASVTYYGLLAIFPFLLFLVALGSVVVDPAKAEQIIQQLSSVAPGAATQILGDRIRSLASGNNGGLLTIGVLGAIWAASGGVVALMRALNVVYDVEEERPFWKVRLIAIGMTLFAAVLSIVSALVMLAAGPVADAVGGPIGTLILWLRFPVALLLMMLVWACLYYVLPDVEQKFQFLTFGSITGVVIWIVASWGFSEYVSHFGKYDATYGALGGVIVLLIWMYLSSTVLLLGAEINAVLEQASPEGKRPGAKKKEDTGTEPAPGAKAPTEKHSRPQPAHARSREERPTGGEHTGAPAAPRGAAAARDPTPVLRHRERPTPAPAVAPSPTPPARRIPNERRPWWQAIAVGVAAGLAGFLYTRRAT